jgi:hypothetical protein
VKSIACANQALVFSVARDAIMMFPSSTPCRGQGTP